MARLRVHSFSLSLDGYGAGPNQRLDAPMGDGREGLHDWMFATRTFQEMIGGEGGRSCRIRAEGNGGGTPAPRSDGRSLRSAWLTRLSRR